MAKTKKTSNSFFSRHKFKIIIFVVCCLIVGGILAYKKYVAPSVAPNVAPKADPNTGPKVAPKVSPSVSPNVTTNSVNIIVPTPMTNVVTNAVTNTSTNTLTNPVINAVSSVSPINCVGHWENDKCIERELHQIYHIDVEPKYGGNVCKDVNGNVLIEGSERRVTSSQCYAEFEQDQLSRRELTIPLYENKLTLDLTRKYDFVLLYEPAYCSNIDANNCYYMLWDKSSANFKNTFGSDTKNIWSPPVKICSEIEGCAANGVKKTDIIGNKDVYRSLARFIYIIKDTSKRIVSFYSFNVKKGIPGVWYYDFSTNKLYFNNDKDEYDISQTLESTFGTNFTHDNIKNKGVIKIV